MGVTLNRATVAKLELASGKNDQIVFDSDLPGFGFRMRADSGHVRRSWVVQYRVRNRTRRIKLGDYPTIDADEARKQAKTKLAKVTLGHDPQAEKEAERRNAARTLRAIAGEYLEMKELAVGEGAYRSSSLRVTRLYLTGRQYFGPLHGMAITDVQLADVARCLNTITRNSGHATAGRARAAVSSLFTWAMRQGYATANPVIGTEDPDTRPSRDRVLTDLELATIWRACGDDDFGKITRLLILTACRREEIGGLRWSEVLDDNTIKLPKERTKNKHEHALPLTPLALAIIKSIPQRAGRDHLFGDRSVKGFTDWERQRSRLTARLDKLAPWKLHDLRRSVATWMAEHGNVEPHIIEAILNHWTGHRSGVAGVYNRAGYARQIRAALSLWDDHLRSLIEGYKRVLVPLKKGMGTTST